MNNTKYFEGVNINVVRETVEKVKYLLKNAKESSFDEAIGQKNLWDCRAAFALSTAVKENNEKIIRLITNLETFTIVLEKAMEVKTIQDMMKASTDYDTSVMHAKEVEDIISKITTLVNGMEYSAFVKAVAGKNTGTITGVTSLKNSTNSKNKKSAIATITGGSFTSGTITSMKNTANLKNTASSGTPIVGTAVGKMKSEVNTNANKKEYSAITQAIIDLKQKNNG